VPHRLIRQFSTVIEIWSAAPSATPPSEAAGWTKIFSTRPDAAIFPLAFEFSATPPARQTFRQRVFSIAIRTTLIIAVSQASWTA
jgi:hypothetical protein